jgi:hypothetical protein
MHKHFPHVKTFVRAFDIENGVMLEKAGATAVVPEILEPSLQLAAAVLSQVRGHWTNPLGGGLRGGEHVNTLGCVVAPQSTH